jgi:hypothetical protein
MDHWVVKIVKNRGQYRVTIPRTMVKEMSWEDVEYLALNRTGENEIKVEEYGSKEKSRG